MKILVAGSRSIKAFDLTGYIPQAAELIIRSVQNRPLKVF